MFRLHIPAPPGGLACRHYTNLACPRKPARPPIARSSLGPYRDVRLGLGSPATLTYGTMCIKQSFRGGMCLFAYLILGLIAGWFVASQGVANSGASDFRGPPPQISRPLYDSHRHPRQRPCRSGRLYVPRSASPETFEPVRGQNRVNRRPRDRTVSEPPFIRPGIAPPVRPRIATGMAKPLQG